MAGTLTVASKMQLPLALQLQHKTQREVEMYGGGTKTVDVYFKDEKVVVLAGCAIDRGKPSEVHLAGGFALTHNVDADFWNEWVAQNKLFPPYAKGLIFAMEKPGATENEAKTRVKVKSGFEPVDPDNPPDEFRGKVARSRA